ncbi:MAG: PilZ domain-containing protein [Deltaproteobacteria bacterium]|nr:PilZ domain-containing protein [Deltaproteobacteria bacterium]
MGEERREHERKKTNLKTSLLLNSREVSGILENISAGGALLGVEKDDGGKIAATDVGQDVLFRMERDGSSVTQRGHICRYVESHGDKYVAIIFTGTPRAWA